MKIIRAGMNDRLLKALSRSAKARHITRSALIREACQRYLERLEEEESDRQYVEAYRRKPESAAVGKAGAKLAALVWPRENWE